ncbi:hypothetical protein JG688_00018508, partial [Phytophthora aleatoria]
YDFSEAVQPVDAAPAKSVRFLRSVKTEDDGEERVSNQLVSLDDLLAKLKINEAVTLNNLNRFDDYLMQKLRENPSWALKIQSWKEQDLNPMQVLTMLRQYPTLSRMHSTEWNAWKIYAAGARAFVRVFTCFEPSNANNVITWLRFWRC